MNRLSLSQTPKFGEKTAYFADYSGGSQGQSISKNERKSKGSGGAASDDWDSFTDSKFSEHHLNEEETKFRSSTQTQTIPNLMKLYVGISFLSVPKFISEVGIYSAIVGSVILLVITLYCQWIIL